MHKLTNDRRKWGVAALLAGSLMLLFELFPPPCVWLPMPRAVVTLDGKPTSLAAVYRSCDGQLLIRIREPGGDVPYVARPSEGEVVLPNDAALLDDNPDDGHWLTTPGFALSREAHPRGEVLGSFYFSINSRVDIQPGCVAFTEENLSLVSGGWRSRRARVQL